MICLILLITFLISPLLWAQTKPNIVVIMTDNLGYGDLGIYGGLRAETPRIDQLARDGVMFRDFQVEPNCTPSRAAFMTGRMPIRSGTSGLVMPGEAGGLHPKEVTIAEVLKGVGYATANFGKWHLGETPDREPQVQGFNQFYGILNTSFPIDSDFPGTDMNVVEPQKVLKAVGGNPSKEVRDMDNDYRAHIDRDLTRMSIEFIQAQAKDNKPFFLLTTYINPHHPVIAHPDFVGKSGGSAYSDVLMEIDYNTGLILDAIDESGIKENTIFVWFSDNGPTRYSLSPDQNGDPGLWSGELGSTWEGSLRTAGMIRWPGKIRNNWVSDEMFHVMDLFTTLSKLAGGNIPNDRPIDGVDQSDFLLGKQEKSARESRAVFFNGQFTTMRRRQFKCKQ